MGLKEALDTGAASKAESETLRQRFISPRSDKQRQRDPRQPSDSVPLNEILGFS
jgi:hypothetical protein